MNGHAAHRPIFTIGYGPRGIEEFLALLEEYRIEYLLDVRSSPDSGREAYQRSRLTETLQGAGITYAPFGKLLGGRPTDADCYRNGHVIYDRCREKRWFRRGVGRLREAWRQGRRVALMCSELRPEECHRSKMIGVGLEEAGIPVAHIDERGQLRSQEEVITRLKSNTGDLFEGASTGSFASRRSYGK